MKTVLASQGHHHWSTLAIVALPIGFGLIVGAVKMVGAWIPGTAVPEPRRTRYRTISPLLVIVGAVLVVIGFVAG